MREEWNKVLEPGGYAGFKMAEGQDLKLFQTERSQVADILSFSLTVPNEKMSMYASHGHNSTWRCSTGAELIGTHGSAMLEIVEDSVGENYLGGGFCNRFSNIRRFGDPSDKTCFENLNMAGREFGIGVALSEGDLCFNAFMNVDYRPDLSKTILEPSAVKGDFLILRALTDQIILISNCPQTRGATNGGARHTLGIELKG